MADRLDWLGLEILEQNALESLLQDGTTHPLRTYVLGSGSQEFGRHGSKSSVGYPTVPMKF
jgi:hypothetical protein